MLGERDLDVLRIELDTIEHDRKSRSGYRVGKSRKRTTEETREAIRLLVERGLGVAAIADKLGLTDAYVRTHLKAIPAPAEPT